MTGKVYANSMLVLINSRMLLGSEETPLAVGSVMRFRTASANSKDDSAIEAQKGLKGDLSVDNEERAGPLRRSEPDEV
jgi:hypothetical protein